ncbi:glycoside hydrolase family 130 protein [Pseudonocardia humida]|uniref:Glycoside hydrolase family 130 protein n=1 Tax=Pseudonocardia humida TaxID=2800819 RepID=A0ABT0ZTG8_9PSEU|nr:glycoside hydrolase family 130 protein [Pseudonocardia humida]MCO1654026.1 glycoside hydrolase family 130 protein [Pseudonocardia humida]
MTPDARAGGALVTRLPTTLTADPGRVLARMFVPGHDVVANTQSRATGVLARVLALSEDDVRRTLRAVLVRYTDRHRDLDGVLAGHYARIAHRVPDGHGLSEQRRTLIGAWFTHEYSIEAAALFNPSAVPHPDQSGLGPGRLRFVLSLRAVGEGHLSSVEFRTGVLGPDAAGGLELTVDDPGPFVETGRPGPTGHDRDLFAALLAEAGADEESASFLLAGLPARFDEDELDRAIGALVLQRATRHGGVRTGELARRLVRCSYEVGFAPGSTIAERVLWPHGPSESAGMEDARFVRVDTDDGPAYRATYTAFDGTDIAPQAIDTTDFRRFRISQLAGPAARNKGMAFFPRTVGGRHLALSRWDRENNSLASSADGRWWGDSRTLHVPSRPWELTQTGNCGSPVETDAGWVVLTHGVGPMREYSMGALLLDLDDPSRVIGGLREPLIGPAEDERDGYVPNVVYSCGALRHGDHLLVPYGASDASVRFAAVDLPLLLDRLVADGPPAATRENSSA